MTFRYGSDYSWQSTHVDRDLHRYAGALDRLYRLLIDKGLFTQRWRPNKITVGGANSLHVTAHGQQISFRLVIKHKPTPPGISGYLGQTQRTAGAICYRA
jgi:hypothetical protein